MAALVVALLHGLAYADQPTSAAVPSVQENLLAMDTNKDGKLTPEELPTAHVRESLPFFDLDGDKMIDRAEWDYYKAAMESTPDTGLLVQAAPIERATTTDLTKFAFVVLEDPLPGSENPVRVEGGLDAGHQGHLRG